MTPDTLATVAAHTQAITTGWSMETTGGYFLFLAVMVAASIWQANLWRGE